MTPSPRLATEPAHAEANAIARPNRAPRIEFGIPRVGWLPLTVWHGSIEQNERVSDVPTDTIGACVLTLERMAAGLKREEVRWHLEPEPRDPWRSTGLTPCSEALARLE